MSKWVLRGCCVARLCRLVTWTCLFGALHILTLVTHRVLPHRSIVLTLVIVEWFLALAVHHAWHWGLELEGFTARESLLHLVTMYVHLAGWNKWFAVPHGRSRLAGDFMEGFGRCQFVHLGEMTKLPLSYKGVWLIFVDSRDKNVTGFAKVSEVQISM